MKSPRPDDNERGERLFLKGVHMKASLISYGKSCDMSKMLEGLESVSVSVVLSGVEIAHIVSPVKGRLASCGHWLGRCRSVE